MNKYIETEGAVRASRNMSQENTDSEREDEEHTHIN